MLIAQRSMALLGQAKMSIRSLIFFAATWLCLLAPLTIGAHASWEVGERIAVEAEQRPATLTCEMGLTDTRSRDCEDTLMRWELCQRVYVSQPHADDAFQACFEGGE
jgi:hypothetical protein